MSSGRNSHWCHHCNRAIQLQGRRLACPYCNEGFIEELPETLDRNAHVQAVFGIGEPFQDPRLGIVDALSEIMRRRMLLQDPNLGLISRHGHSGTNRSYGPTPGSSTRPRSRVLIFHGQSNGDSIEDPFESFFGSGNGMGQRPTDFSSFFTDHGLQELFEQLSMTERQGPLPAPRSAIDAMPTIKITQRHINTDAHCPVCQDKFELGSKARKMPCEHIYHSNCIIPWLVQHNSCPVCRVELPSQGTSSSRGGSNQQIRNPNVSSGSSNRGDNSHGDNQSRRNPFSFLFPSN